MGVDEPVAGAVERWSDGDGRGVLRSDAVDGSVLAHFSHGRDRPGYRSLQPGQRVWSRFERPGQDGCDARATDVRTAGPPFVTLPEPDGPPGAHRSSVEITFDPPGGSSPPSP